jgi:biofilm PGA synthesis lipoprotein PgaB
VTNHCHETFHPPCCLAGAVRRRYLREWARTAWCLSRAAALALAVCFPAIIAHAKTAAGVEKQCPSALRAVQVDLDYVYDPDPAQQQRNANLLIQRVKSLQVNTVFLQAFADPLGDGLARSLYFPNRWLPVRSNLFGHVAEQLRTQTGVQVYAWMPVLSFYLKSVVSPVLKGETDREGTLRASPVQYQRLSPFDPLVRQQIGDIYEDLGRNSVIDGLLFHDDAIMSDFEDTGPAALAAYREQGLPTRLSELRSNPDTLHHWTRFKSETLNILTVNLRDRAQAASARHLKTARNLFALPVLNPDAETWFAQSLDDFLGVYDWTVIMAMPLMEGIPLTQSTQWLETLVKQARQRDAKLAHTVFELQTRDWASAGQPPIPGETLMTWATSLAQLGACHLAYYPDDFYRNQPDATTIRAIMGR